ncbi:MAG: PEP-CTERM sorting domain-containing protein [Verrucomicrobiota bacterium]
MKQKFTKCILAVASASLLGTSASQAANSFFATGDLMLFFQKAGSSNTVYASLGNTATEFRSATTGAGVQHINIIDLNSTLTSAFGAGWASDTEIYAGLAGVWGNSSTSTTLGPTVGQGDPHRTIYVSSPRLGVGVEGEANSVGWDLTEAGNGALTGASSQIISMNNILETNYTTQTVVSPTGVSLIDDRNPFLSTALGIQGQAFGLFDGGVQQRGTAGTFGSFTETGSAEFALDLYRILGKNNIPGQVGGTNSVGSYEGTVVIGTDGMVSFIPEPSSTALLGVAALGLLRRRRSA